MVATASSLAGTCWVSDEGHGCVIAGTVQWRYNQTMHSGKENDTVVTVDYEDGHWSLPYFDCGGGDIWMMTYTVPFFSYTNGTPGFK